MSSGAGNSLQGRSAAPPSSTSTSRKRGRAPASNKAILGLRRVTAAADCSSTDCAICLQDFDFDSDDDIRALPCPHAFHRHCISTWLRRDAVCPLCRHQLPTTEQDEQAAGDGLDEDEEERSLWWRRSRTGPMGPPVSTLYTPTTQGGADEEFWRRSNEETIRWMDRSAAANNMRLSFF